MADGVPAIFNGAHNISMAERAASMIGGLALAASAVKQRPNPLWNLLAFAGGGYLALRGATGHCPIKAALTGGESPPATVQ